MLDDGVILAHDSPSGRLPVPVLRVRSIPPAIRNLGRYVRAHVQTPSVAVTGSVGKTSSCHLLRHLLGAERVTTNGQNNMTDGVAFETANLVDSDYLVAEVELRAIGEATDILSPFAAILTWVSPVHVRKHFDARALTERKAAIFRSLRPGGTAIINRDIQHFDLALDIARSAGARVLTFGEHPEADYQLLAYQSGEQQVRAKIAGETVTYALGLSGHHMAVNSLGCLAAAEAVNCSRSELLPRLASARPHPGRGDVTRLTIRKARITLIDDAYNASPASMEAAFRNLGETKPSGNGRRIAVLADMLELGEESAVYHRALARPLQEAGIDCVYLAGQMMVELWKELPETMRASLSTTPVGILGPLVNDLGDGDVVLIKGSHGTLIHRLVDDLRFLAAVGWMGPAGVPALLSAKAIASRLEEHLPDAVARWVDWQVRKIAKRSTGAGQRQ